MFAAGALTLFFGWMLPEIYTGIVTITLLLSSVFIPLLMSFIWWRQKYGKSAAK